MISSFLFPYDGAITFTSLSHPTILYHQQLDLIHMVLGQDLRTQTVIYFLIAGRAGW